MECYDVRPNNCTRNAFGQVSKDNAGVVVIGNVLSMPCVARSCWESADFVVESMQGLMVEVACQQILCEHIAPANKPLAGTTNPL